jgi:transposase
VRAIVQPTNNYAMKAILGLDVSKDKFDAALLLEQRTFQRQFRNSPAGFAALRRWLDQHAIEQLHAGLEATGRYSFALACFLHAQYRTVSLLNPLALRHYARAKFLRNKQDRLDAELIATYVQKENPRCWTPPSQAQLHRQELSRLLQARKEQLQQERNRLESGPLSCTVRSAIRRWIRLLEMQVAQLEAELLASLQLQPQSQRDWQLLQSIPGIGPLTAAIILAELPPHLRSARAAAAYAGLTPAREQSGRRDQTKGLSVLGNRALRRALFLPAISAVRHNPPIRAKAERLTGAGKSKMCIVGAAMHQLLRQAWGVLKHQQSFDPQWNSPLRLATSSPPN